MKGSKEHFGFRDGISQPALLGLRDDGSLFDGQRAEDDGGPPRTTNAQDLVWPGEAVFLQRDSCGAFRPGGEGGASGRCRSTAWR